MWITAGWKRNIFSRKKYINKTAEHIVRMYMGIVKRKYGKVLVSGR